MWQQVALKLFKKLCEAFGSTRSVEEEDENEQETVPSFADTYEALQKDVFRTTKPLGSFAAILSTYAVSSLLHGLNFQLAAVLLSLGAYTYVEYVLRQKLATVFGACIQVRPCRRECSHRNKEKRLAVVLGNIGLGLVAMFHLSYLGVMFDVSSKLQEEGYNYAHTLAKWSVLSYASHWVALGTYIFYLLV